MNPRRSELSDEDRTVAREYARGAARLADLDPPPRNWLAKLGRRQPLAGHVGMVAVPGGTARHLRDRHGVEPTEDKTENIALHFEAHGATVDRVTGAVTSWPATDGPVGDSPT